MFTYLKKHPTWLLTLLLALVFMMVPTIAGAQCSTFLCLTDTPGSYSNAHALLAVNAAEDGLVEVTSAAAYNGVLYANSLDLSAGAEVDGDVIIGSTVTPGAALEIHGQASPTALEIETFSDDSGDESRIHFYRSHTDSDDTYVETVSGEDLGLLAFKGVDMTDNLDYGAYVLVEQSAAAGAKVPTRIRFFTSDATETTAALKIDSDKVEATNDLEVGDDLSVEGFIGSGDYGSDPSNYTFWSNIAAYAQTFSDNENGGHIIWANDNIEADPPNRIFDDDDVGGPKWMLLLNYVCTRVGDEGGGSTDSSSDAGGPIEITPGEVITICDADGKALAFRWNDDGGEIYTAAEEGSGFRAIFEMMWLND